MNQEHHALLLMEGPWLCANAVQAERVLLKEAKEEKKAQPGFFNFLRAMWRGYRGLGRKGLPALPYLKRQVGALATRYPVETGLTGLGVGVGTALGARRLFGRDRPVVIS